VIWLTRECAFVPRTVAAIPVIGSVGCGPDGSDAPGALAASFDDDVSGSLLRPGDAVQFVASDFEFMPGELVAEAGSYSGQSINEGSITHNTTFSNGESFDVKPGESTSIEFSVLDEDVTYICAIEGHAEAGMTGTIHTPSSAADDEDESE
jgi:plastocyanin